MRKKSNGWVTYKVEALSIKDITKWLLGEKKEQNKDRRQDEVTEDLVNTRITEW